MKVSSKLSRLFNNYIMRIMIKSTKFEYLSEKVTTKLFQKKEIFIEVGRIKSIYDYYILLYSLRLINITLLFIISWNFSNRFYFYFLFQNKIEIDIYVFHFNIIRYFSYKIGSTLIFCDIVSHDDIYYDEYLSAAMSEELSFFP